MNNEHLLNNYFGQLHILNHLILNQPYEAGTSIIPSFWMKHRCWEACPWSHSEQVADTGFGPPGSLNPEFKLFISE